VTSGDTGDSANNRENDLSKKPVKLHQGRHQEPKHVRPQLAAPWKPGESGNPAGRPLGSRNKLSESVIQDIAADWAIGGAAGVGHQCRHHTARTPMSLERNTSPSLNRGSYDEA